MLGSALVYSAVLLGPWGCAEDCRLFGRHACPGWPMRWLSWRLSWPCCPGLFCLAVSLGTGGGPAARPVREGPSSNLAYALVPLGLGAWIAFSLSFVFVNLSYLWPALSDPFGWGWNLFGTAGHGLDAVFDRPAAPSPGAGAGRQPGLGLPDGAGDYPGGLLLPRLLCAGRSR